MKWIKAKGSTRRKIERCLFSPVIIHCIYLATYILLLAISDPGTLARYFCDRNSSL